MQRIVIELSRQVKPTSKAPLSSNRATDEGCEVEDPLSDRRAQRGSVLVQPELESHPSWVTPVRKPSPELCSSSSARGCAAGIYRVRANPEGDEESWAAAIMIVSR